MNSNTEQMLEKFGFRFGVNRPHAARTMMSEDISSLLDQLPINAGPDSFERQVFESNVLGKPTKKARELSLRHLSTICALDPQVPLLQHDAGSRKLLAIQIAVARDPLLRGTQTLILSKKSEDQQLIGWNPDLNGGVRVNIRPIMTAEVLRHNKKPKLNITWDKDRGKDAESAPWFKVFKGELIIDHHLTLAEKRKARGIV